MRTGAAWVAEVAVAVVVLDRVLLWMERHGWIDGRRTRRRAGADVGTAFLEVESMIDPRKRPILEVRMADEYGQDDADDGRPPAPGRTGG